MPAAPAAAQQNPPAKDDTVQTFKVQVNVVNVFFNVKDKHGALVPNLTQSDFELLEEGRPQTIKYFAAETNQPLTLGMMIDSSGSQGRVLDMEKEVGAQFLHEVLGPKDLAFVISFDVQVELLQDLTNSQRDLRAALDSARINVGGGGYGPPGMGGGPFPTHGVPKGTLLYDAVYLAAHDVLGNEVGRKAMILLTDGQDQGSRTTIREAVEMAQKADSMIYVLLCADRGFYGGGGFGSGGYEGDRDMKKLVEDTGGRVIDVGNKPEKLKEAFDQIQAELRSQYSIGYTSDDPKHDGSFRRIELRAKKGELKVQARKGYYAPLAK
jgi:VWFA-related protein